MEEIHKVCTKCNLNKPLSQYANCKRGLHNKQPKCKDCNKLYREANRDKIIQYLRNYYEDNEEELALKGIEWVKNNSDKIKAYKKQWFLENKESVAKKAKERYLNKKDEIQEYKKKYYELNKESIIKKSTKLKKERKEKDPLFKLKLSISSTVRTSMKNRHKKSKVTEDIISCNYQYFRQHIEKQFESWMTWDNYGNACEVLEPNCSWDLDHIVPASLAENEEELYLLNHWSNFQPLCSFKNRNIKRHNIYPVTNLELNITYE